MIERLEIIKNKYEDMQKELMKPEVLSDINKTTELSREMASLEEIVNHYKRYMEVDKELEEAKELMKDPELGEMAKSEYDSLIPWFKKKKIWSEN